MLVIFILFFFSFYNARLQNDCIQRISLQVKELVNLYKSLVAYPLLSSAQILGAKSGKLSIQGSWTQRNLERKTDQRFLQNYDLNSDLTPISTGFPVDITTEYAIWMSLTDNLEYLI